ncbi:TolB family protein [Marinitoga litoralis]|jgi:TolB protein|uniref:TolB family protein n=1 Tax=Marinitoga litoralis TaxID=570855 RepID=UPI001961DA25|nr:PD40 domain-containing protein [Marinitoga litoralis]MBM7559165.1 TolB protein [Marinitoga litoralis]
MKRIFTLFFLIIISFVFSQIKIEKENILLIQNSNSWIMNQIIQEFESKLLYSYNVYKNMEDINYNIKLEFTEDSSRNSVRVVASFDSTKLDLSEKIVDNDNWVRNFTTKVLEKIAFKRFIFDQNWNFIQLTYWDGIDEYPYISSEGDKIIFISDRYTGNRNIWGYDLIKNKYINISLDFSSEYFPSITEDGTFVFQSSLYGKWDVLLYNPEKEDIFRISNDSYNAYTPYYKNGEVYFSVEERNGESWTEIYKYSLKDKQITKITSLKNTFKFKPSVYKNRIIFQMIDSKTGRSNIYVYDGSKISPIIISELNEVDPIANDNYIVYSKYKNGYYRITLFDPISNNEEFLTMDISDDAFYPYIYNNIVFFSLYYKNGEPDIFAIRLP